MLERADIPHAGGDNNLAVIVGSYNIPAQCRGQFKPWESCRELLSDMPATTGKEIFGPESDPAATVKLPQAVISGMVPLKECFSQRFSDLVSSN